MLYILAFEEHKHLWVFTKPLLPTMLVNEKYIESVKAQLMEVAPSEDVRSRLDEGL